jgi:hypothetical protein
LQGWDVSIGVTGRHGSAKTGEQKQRQARWCEFRPWHAFCTTDDVGYDQVLEALKRELDEAREEFEQESNAIRAGTLSFEGARPKAERFSLALQRYHTFLLEGRLTTE